MSPSGQETPIDVVVLSYARPSLLRDCLASLANQSAQPSRVVVVDNHSPLSGTVADVAREFPGFELIANRVNLGFSGGMNVGVRAAVGEFVCLTEDDVVLDRDCLAELLKHARGHPEVGLYAPILYNRRAGTIRCAGGEVTLGLTFRLHVNGWGEPDTGRFVRPFDAGYVPGAFVFARLAFLRELGGYREDFFMYKEDVDLCLRVRARGRVIRVVPGAKAYHEEPSPVPVSPEVEFHKIKNLFAVYLLHARPAVAVGALLKYGAHYLAVGTSAGEQGRAARRALAWVLRHLVALVRERTGPPPKKDEAAAVEGHTP